ncbi:MAG: hypothetical protein RLZZ117_1384 [Cyanobacteriota bacterium]|jgi:hypothetical protein
MHLRATRLFRGLFAVIVGISLASFLARWAFIVWPILVFCSFYALPKISRSLVVYIKTMRAELFQKFLEMIRQSVADCHRWQLVCIHEANSLP